MGAERCYYMIGIGTPGWNDMVTMSIPGGIGGGLTDPRFAVPGEAGFGIQLDPYPSFRASATVGQYLPPEHAQRWQIINVKLYDGRERNRSFPKQPPHYVTHWDAPCVSAKVREVIERVEPGRHQFIAAKAIAWDTGEELWAGQDFYVLNVLNWIAPEMLFDLKAMTPSSVQRQGAEKFGEDFIFRVRPYHPDTYIIRAEWLDTGHMIRTGSYRPHPGMYWHAYENVFVSDVLQAALAAEFPNLRSEKIPIGEPNAYWRMVQQKRAEARANTGQDQS